jgi:archaemetzincin
VVGVVDVDLFVPIFTHVFGEARHGGGAALVSLFRLAANPGRAWRLTPEVLERAAKIALHELSHLFSLPHCTDDHCLMHFSGDLDMLDRTPLTFCRYCTAFFRSAARRPAGVPGQG